MLIAHHGVHADVLVLLVALLATVAAATLVARRSGQ